MVLFSFIVVLLLCLVGVSIVGIVVVLCFSGVDYVCYGSYDCGVLGWVDFEVCCFVLLYF